MRRQKSARIIDRCAFVDPPLCIGAPSPTHIIIRVRGLLRHTESSILVDRLAELSVRGGHLLLLCSTKTGVETFIFSHLNPTMDPFLREFIFLGNLFFQIGTMLGVSTVCFMLCTTSFVDFPLRVWKHPCYATSHWCWDPSCERMRTKMNNKTSRKLIGIAQR